MQGSNKHCQNVPLCPPPVAIPQYCPFLKDSGPDYIQQYMNCIVYVWTTFGNSFWVYPVDCRNRVLFAYAWDGSDWKYIQFRLELIDSIY